MMMMIEGNNNNEQAGVEGGESEWERKESQPKMRNEPKTDLNETIYD